jgi:hypothetical protein
MTDATATTRMAARAVIVVWRPADAAASLGARGVGLAAHER